MCPRIFGDYAPRNFDGGFNGMVSARDALRMSLNVPAVMVLERVGPVRFATTLENAGAAHRLSRQRKTRRRCPSRWAGSASRLRDITMLYAGIAGGGEAHAVARDAWTRRAANPFRLFGPAAAWYLHEIL